MAATMISIRDLITVFQVDETRISALISEGLLPASDSVPEVTARRARRVLRLERELDVELHAAAIILDLMEKLEQLSRSSGSLQRR